jgi:hypothetical protein
MRTSLVTTAIRVLAGKSRISHAELINSVCAISGCSYESVRGTLIKRDCTLFKDGWQYSNGYLTKGTGEAILTDYTHKPKLTNWESVRDLLPSTIKSLVTLGGVNGTDIEVFQPESCISYDYSDYVLSQLKRKMPWVETRQGNIFKHDKPVTLLNLDLVGYMCGSLFNSLQSAASVGHGYIAITIQAQVGGFRNTGEWKNNAVRRYAKYKDKNLRALKDAMEGYECILNRFYRRTPNARTMRTTLWRCI